MNYTPQELRVMELLWEGHNMESVANQIDCAYDTAKHHVSNLRRKTRSSNTTEMAMKTFKEFHYCVRKSEAAE